VAIARIGVYAAAVPPTAIPLDVADLTPEWCTSVLARHHPGVEVAAVDVVDAHSGTTGRALLRLEYRGDAAAGDPAEGTALPGTVFCKLAPFGERQRRLLQEFGIGAVEARFYAELAGEVGVRVPGVWHADFADDGSFIMVLEDLGASGCRFRRGGAGDPAERAGATVDALARLHARYWESPRFEGDLAWIPERAGFGKGDGRDAASLAASAHFARMALDAFADEMPPAFGEVGSFYCDHVGEVLDLWDEGARTLIHGDPHEGNLFDDGEVAGFYDWAMFSHSPGVRDVAYHLATSIPAEVRRSEERDLLARYRGGLHAAGVELAAADADRQYRIFAVFAWVSMASTAAMGSRWQPVELALEATRRATAAVGDLGSVDLLRDLLA
jgi:hypothetical protein